MRLTPRECAETTSASLKRELLACGVSLGLRACSDPAWVVACGHGGRSTVRLAEPDLGAWIGDGAKIRRLELRRRYELHMDGCMHKIV